MKACVSIIGVLIAIASCEKTGTVQHPADSLANGDEQQQPGASRPARALKPHFFVECFDVYAECRAARGLPAVSSDGSRVAIADTGAKNARDEFVISVRIAHVGTRQPDDVFPLMTYDDRATGLDQDTGEPTPALRRQIETRIDHVETLLARGDYRPLTYLGKVHEQRSSDVVGGMRATFDGRALTIASGDAVRWRREIEPWRGSDDAQVDAPSQSPSGDTSASVSDTRGCGSYPVAEIHVWVHHGSGIALARVSYTTLHGCDVAPRYLILK